MVLSIGGLKKIHQVLAFTTRMEELRSSKRYFFPKTCLTKTGSIDCHVPARRDKSASNPFFWSFSDLEREGGGGGRELQELCSQ